MTPEIARPKFRIAAVAVSVLSALLGACGDLTGVPASLNTVTDSTSVYALNGAPSGAPTALHVFSGTLLPVTSSFVFDVAFDIDAAGNAVLLPQRTVASRLTSSHSVGLQKLNASFDAVTSAPKSGYRADTAMVAPVNQVVAIQATDPDACGISLTGTTLYAKVVVLAIDRVARQLTIRYTVDPNCGFVSFAPGLPKD